MRVQYNSNNSGGDWWLTDANWLALEQAGWKVNWCRNEKRHNSDGRRLGALATSATREGLPLDKAIAEFEQITGCNSNDQGCPCCGAPHDFVEYDADNNYVASK